MSNEDWRERAERIERTIAFIIKQRAQAEVRAAEAKERRNQADERRKQADESWAKTDERWACTEQGIKSLLAVAEINEREIQKLREAGRVTDERISALINVMDQQSSESRNNLPET